MDTSPLVRITLEPSRLAALLVCVACGATAVLVEELPLAAGVRATGVIGIGIYALWLARHWADRTSPRSIVGIEVGMDQQVTLIDVRGERITGEVRSDSYVSAMMTTIVMRPKGSRLSRTVAILPDMLAVDDFRRLRVLLRFGQKSHAESQ